MKQEELELRNCGQLKGGSSARIWCTKKEISAKNVNSSLQQLIHHLPTSLHRIDDPLPFLVLALLISIVCRQSHCCQLFRQQPHILVQSFPLFVFANRILKLLSRICRRFIPFGLGWLSHVMSSLHSTNLWLQGFAIRFCTRSWYLRSHVSFLISLDLRKHVPFPVRLSMALYLPF
ncbi:hypothetical protein BDU57DRAFT_112281 [Ampelomyces quisqualis]|uniref:Uncharacterized protein n=1 Tax=Ampelomyces quisqualis TaxID=50730 RepID=A0A6A5Q8K6_AMPQU|nr:hypothetical protein BDU57DRAFT_112281 [Ampelomyces quisqualis]